MEFLYYPAGCESLDVDDEWIYCLVNSHVARMPKRAGETDEIEQIGPVLRAGVGPLVVDGGDKVYWASSEALVHEARLYAYDKATADLQVTDLGFTYLLMGLHVTDRYAVTLASDCLFAAVVDRGTFEVTTFSRPDGEYTGGTQYGTAVHGDYLYCEDAGKVYRAPLSGGEFVVIAEMTSELQALIGWGDHLLFAGTGQPRGGAGVLNVAAELGAIQQARSPVNAPQAFATYSEKHRTVYWMMRLVDSPRLILLDVDTWAQATVEMPSYVGSPSSLAQDDEYLYWGESDKSPTISRTRKLTVAELEARFVSPDEPCYSPVRPTNGVCWEEPPIAGMNPDFVTPSNVASPPSATTPDASVRPSDATLDGSATDAGADGG